MLVYEKHAKSPARLVNRGVRRSGAELSYIALQGKQPAGLALAVLYSHIETSSWTS